MLYGHNVILGMIILPNGTSYWNPPFPDGDETISIIYFKAICQERGTEKPPSSCDLVLVETDIFDDDGETIPDIMQGGSYWIPPTHIGISIMTAEWTWMMFIDVQKLSEKHQGPPRGDPVVEINGDGRIDMANLYICCKAFGR
jgi:hypothetical protein